MKAKSAIAILFFSLSLFAEKILLMPFHIEEAKPNEIQTINELFTEFMKDSLPNAQFITDSSADCRQKECAATAAQNAGAEEVIFGTARKLGNKWIMSAFRFRPADQKMVASLRLDSRSMEDFEFVMKRLAAALCSGKTLIDVATIDNITETEQSETQFRRRTGFRSIGLRFGYLFPMGNSSYLYQPEQGFYYLSYPPQPKQYRQVLSTDLTNWFELQKNLVLDWTCHVGWGAEIGTSFDLLKLFSREDFTPFIGGGLGMDYVFADKHPDSTSKTNSGFALNAKGGMLFFRTYDLNLTLSGGYKVVFNSDTDHGLFVDMGILWRRNTEPSQIRSSGSDPSPVTRGLAVIGGIVVFLVVMGVAIN